MNDSPWSVLQRTAESAAQSQVGRDPRRAGHFLGRLLRVVVEFCHVYAAPPFHILLVAPLLSVVAYQSDGWGAIWTVLAIVAFCVGIYKSHHWATLAVIAGDYLLLLLLYFIFEVREPSYLGAVWFGFGVVAAVVDNYFRIRRESEHREFVN